MCKCTFVIETIRRGDRVAVGRQTCIEVSKVLGTTLASTTNIFELEQKRGLIQSGRRGKGVHLQLSEFVNFLIGHGVEPRNALGRLIPEWRAAPATPTTGWIMRPPRLAAQYLRGAFFGEVSIELDAYRNSIFPDLSRVVVDDQYLGGMDSRCYQVLPGPTLGEALRNFIDHLSQPHGQRLRIALRKTEWTLRLTSSKLAQVAYLEEGIEFSSQFTASGYSLQTPAYVRSTTFGFAVFETLADLWADSRAQMDGKNPLSSSGSVPSSDGTPEDENAALPGATSSDTSLRPNTPSGICGAQIGGFNNHNPTVCVHIPSRGDRRRGVFPETLEQTK